MNPLITCTALVALLCAQILVAESQGDSGYTFPDDSKVGLNEFEGEDEVNLRQLADYIMCKLLRQDDCEEETYDTEYEKRGKGKLGLMFGRRAADLAKRGNVRRKSFV